MSCFGFVPVNYVKSSGKEMPVHSVCDWLIVIYITWLTEYIGAGRLVSGNRCSFIIHSYILLLFNCTPRTGLLWAYAFYEWSSWIYVIRCLVYCALVLGLSWINRFYCELSWTLLSDLSWINWCCHKLSWTLILFYVEWDLELSRIIKNE